MNQREKILAVIVLLLVAAWAGSAWYGRYQDELSSRRAAVQDAKARLAEVNLALAEGRMAVQKLEEWQKRSLPRDRERALSLYKAWLLAKAKDAGLTVDDIKPSPRSMTGAGYTTVAYRMEATGPLSAMVAMLYEFYRSPQLHQITHLRLSRPVGESPMRLTLETEALSLPGAVTTDSLPEGDSKRLKLASLEAYQKSLGERDPVAVYSAKNVAQQKNDSSPTDDSQHARFSASVPGVNGLQAWVNVASTGETLHLATGDALKIGKLEGQVVSIEPRSMTYQSGDKKFRVALGQPLREGKELDAGSSAPSESPNRDQQRQSGRQPSSEQRGSSPPG